MFRCLASTGGMNNGVFKTVLIATGVHSLLAEKEKPIMSDMDIKNIKKMA